MRARSWFPGKHRNDDGSYSGVQNYEPSVSPEAKASDPNAYGRDEDRSFREYRLHDHPDFRYLGMRDEMCSRCGSDHKTEDHVDG